jgi:hypothetical protein
LIYKLQLIPGNLPYALILLPRKRLELTLD